jgi:hypothetical protein
MTQSNVVTAMFQSSVAVALRTPRAEAEFRHEGARRLSAADRRAAERRPRNTGAARFCGLGIRRTAWRMGALPERGGPERQPRVGCGQSFVAMTSVVGFSVAARWKSW